MKSAACRAARRLRAPRETGGAVRLLALILLVSACQSPADRCAEAAAIYDALPDKGAVNAGLVLGACMG